MSKWNLIIDVAECHNCHNCVVAAKDELVGNHFPRYSAPHPAQGQGAIRIERHVRGRGHHLDTAYLPRMCQHCDDAPCVKAAGGAVSKRADGIVLFDPEACRGRRDLTQVCPYGAVIWNEELQLPQTWFFDAHLLDAGWREPRCVTVCPTRALQAVRIDDAAMAERARAEGLRTLHPEAGTRPRVYYRHLARIDGVFVAGSVVDAGAAECVEGAQVELLRDGRAVAQARTDAFGDFRIDGLSPDSGAYQLVARHELQGSARRQVQVGPHSAVLGDIALEP
ncbi:MAG: carboxypeptidase regulatory-like domain-containing protein [Burkholderiales bacterium]|nr:carboxypeptidase regulatory-like domain-containing protein [Burkholderiales bacterium]